MKILLNAHRKAGKRNEKHKKQKASKKWQT